MSKPLQPVDHAVEMAEDHLDYCAKHATDYMGMTFRGAQAFVAHCERDGVVARSGPRAAEERPQRATRTLMRVRLHLSDHAANPFGIVHGGCIATLIDTISSLVVRFCGELDAGYTLTLQLFMHSPGSPADVWGTAGVSTSLSVQYLRPTPVAGWLELETEALIVGKSTCSLLSHLYLLDGRDGKRVHRTATGIHNKVRGTGVRRVADKQTDVSGRQSKM